MKQTKKNLLTSSSLGKLAYAAPAALVLSLSGLSFTALATSSVADANSASNLLLALTTDTTASGGDALNAAYIVSREATRGFLSADFLKSLDGDLFVEAKFGNKSRLFNNQLAATGNPLGPQEAVLTSSAKGLVIGTNLASLSTNGTDKLVVGAFGGYGQIDFATALSASGLATATKKATEADEKLAEASKVLKDAQNAQNATTDEGKAAIQTAQSAKSVAEKLVKDAANAMSVASTVQAQAKGFGGGLSFAFQSNADAKTGLFANGGLSFDRFDHGFQLFRPKTEKVVESVDEKGNIIVPEKPATEAGFKESVGFSADTLRGKLAVAYVAQLPEIGGFAFFATPNAKFEFSRQIGLGAIADSKNTTSKPFFVQDLQAGLKLSGVFLDGSLESFIGADFLSTSEFEDKDVLKKEPAKTANKLSAGVSYKLADNFALSAEVGSTSRFQQEGEADAEGEGFATRDLSGKFGLAYLF